MNVHYQRILYMLFDWEDDWEDPDELWAVNGRSLWAQPSQMIPFSGGNMI